MTSDMGEMFDLMRAGKRAIRQAFGQPCPRCVELLPRANPTILLPGQRCRIHKYVDPRPHTTLEQRNAAYAAAGLSITEQEPQP